MSEQISPSSREFFERMYAASADPWNFCCDPYELSRYDAIIAALETFEITPPQVFLRAFEPGCSVGVLTERLAPFCGYLMANDISLTAVARARSRCAAHAHVFIEQGSVADANPSSLDLIVLSEIGYYSTSEDLDEWGNRLLADLQLGGTLLAAHWLGSSPDHILSGDRVHSVLHDLALYNNCALKLAQRTNNFRIDKWIRTK